MIAELRRMAVFDWLVITFTWTTIWAIDYFLRLPEYAFWLMQIFAVLVIAGRFHALGVILHDAAHSSLKSKNAGLTFHALCAYPIATTLEAMRYHHLRHHQLYGTDLDPYLKRDLADLDPRLSLFRAVIVTFLKASALVPVWIVRPLVGVLAIRFLTIKAFYRKALLQDREQNSYESEEFRECLTAEIGQLIFWLLLVSFCVFLTKVMKINGTTIFLFYFLPLWVAGFVNVWRVLFEHDHSYRRGNIVGQDPVGVWRTTKRITVPGFDWFFAPRNIGYHQAHHLFPAVRLKHLPELHRRLFADLNHNIVSDSVTGVPVAKGSN